MSEEELKLEWDHVYTTRLAILIGNQPVTVAAMAIAMEEADAHCERLKP
jgi:hypothetical protein